MWVRWDFFEGDDNNDDDDGNAVAVAVTAAADGATDTMCSMSCSVSNKFVSSLVVLEPACNSSHAFRLSSVKGAAFCGLRGLRRLDGEDMAGLGGGGGGGGGTSCSSGPDSSASGWTTISDNGSG